MRSNVPGKHSPSYAIYPAPLAAPNFGSHHVWVLPFKVAEALKSQLQSGKLPPEEFLSGHRAAQDVFKTFAHRVGLDLRVTVQVPVHAERPYLLTVA